ncbi:MULTISPECIES: FAD-binding protein [Glaesserella]|uniref:L-aspartate oxidase n=1 Tax=Glaesserella australis TaxID=2094024 RepID=A0A328BXH8_9PAST|nr:MULTISPECIES: FAD-binding protein [Glaesserella]AUI65915.1 FAD-binding dehydrogenase [Glaesserella sp. 15-184]RAL18365.1 FAD-binding dehydrogenase [Glaesserella australis]
MIPIISHHIQTDLLIVGGGIAGLACCAEAKKHGIQATLITKAPIGSGASFFPLKATLGIQVTGDQADHVLFKEDIERVAQGMNNPKIVQAYIEESPQAIELLERIGFKPWKRNDNRPACFAKYPRPIYLINQWREAAERAKQIVAEQGTTVYEEATLLHIVTAQNQVQGALFSHKISGEIRYIFCKTSQIILATGGISGLYKDNLYPADVIGSTHAIAERAGARLTNLEFIQFIPAFVEPKYKVLFGEHTLKYVQKITDSQGRNLFEYLSESEFKQMVTERSDYAPFSIDFPCVEFDLVMMKHLLENPQEKGIYLHYSPELYQDETEFYTVYLNWLEREVGINLVRDRIAIAPFAHSCNGGVVIDEFAQSDVKGLFAVGEVSSCIEGANRLGGNSVGGSLVFAKRAIQRILQNFAENRPLVSLQECEKNIEQFFLSLDNPKGDRMLTASDVLSTIRSQMAMFANVYRTEVNLTQLLQCLVQLEQRYCPLEHHRYQGIEIYHALKAAQSVVKAMLKRKVSLGGHYFSKTIEK